ncbi:MAG: winged helix-turn-helix domain-containing protein [Nitrososphaera sp.]|uniref:winged helix-turn-helix domain-containing protein n=1 Tax=Nitrososphaera sp. TaxID=1971748 RepID=UPI003D6F9943
MRPREAIIADILQIATEPTKSTRIVYLANLSNSQFSSYMRFLQDRRLIKKREDKTWLITGRGKEYLMVYSALRRILDNVEQAAPFEEDYDSSK